MTKLTKKEICAISFRHFGTMYKEANPKPVLVSGLEGLIAAQPLVLPAAAAAAAAGAPAAAPAAPVATAAAAEGDSEDEYEEEDEKIEGREGGKWTLMRPFSGLAASSSHFATASAIRF